jgi:hypothetical protein
MRYFLFIVFGLIVVSVQGQSTNAPLNPDYYHLLDRFEVLYGKNSPSFQSVYKGYTRSSIANFLDSIRASGMELSRSDLFNLTYLENDNWEWTENAQYQSVKPLLKHFYKAKSDIYHYRDENVDFHINPVLHLSAGAESDGDVTTWTNTRGIELRGVIDNKVGFYSFLGENQATFPKYVRDYTTSKGVVPHEGFWKNYSDNGLDYFHARGYISFPISRHINTQFGHDRFFIGNGYRSMILSDFSPPYLFLKFNTNVGRVQYTNLFTQMRADAFGRLGGSPSGDDFPNKYVVLHHLSVNIGKNLNLGVFESIAYGREDSTGYNGFDINYLNPVIFYRAIEQQNGSTDNVLVGADFRWNVAKKFSFYGQLVLDEFVLDEVRSGDGWWANKHAYQLGVKYINAGGIDNLDLLLEYNYSRPYTYSHQNIYNNYGHYIQEIAHPLGSNLKELVTELRYQPFNKFTFILRSFLTNYGADEDANTNWGGNIFKDNRTREQDYGNETGQGVSTDLLFLDFTTTYHFKHNVFFDLKYIYRDLVSEISTRNNETHYLSFSLRWNIPQRLHEF